MKWADKIDMKLSSPITSERLRKLLDDRRLVATASKSRPTGVTRVVVLDEVDVYSRPEHQSLPITTRG